LPQLFSWIYSIGTGTVWRPDFVAITIQIFFCIFGDSTKSESETLNIVTFLFFSKAYFKCEERTNNFF
jgi:hypothetical protein